MFREGPGEEAASGEGAPAVAVDPEGAPAVAVNPEAAVDQPEEDRPPPRGYDAAFRCPLCGELMTDPVILISSGESFERAALSQARGRASDGSRRRRGRRADVPRTGRGAAAPATWIFCGAATPRDQRRFDFSARPQRTSRRARAKTSASAAPCCTRACPRPCSCAAGADDGTFRRRRGARRRPSNVDSFARRDAYRPDVAERCHVEARGPVLAARRERDDGDGRAQRAARASRRVEESPLARVHDERGEITRRERVTGWHRREICEELRGPRSPHHCGPIVFAQARRDPYVRETRRKDAAQGPGAPWGSRRRDRFQATRSLEESGLEPAKPAVPSARTRRAAAKTPTTRFRGTPSRARRTRRPLAA